MLIALLPAEALRLPALLNPNTHAAAHVPPQATEDRALKEAKYDEEHPVRLEVEIELWQ